jgi:crotonobetainyl-CoA:carnitine CoA-transferase CaiB-like acyl-CoA transferase
LAGPFTGLRILDFSRDRAGKYSTMIMSDMGAEVIRVDPPQEKIDIDPEDRLFNRGKKSLTIDLESKKKSDFLNDLVKSSDLLVHTWLVKEAKSAFMDYEKGSLALMHH